MKAAAFEYVRAHDLEHVLQLLEAYGGDAKPIAGGQSLVPMMAMRLARPALLVDINRLAALRGIEHGEAHDGAGDHSKRAARHAMESDACLASQGDGHEYPRRDARPGKNATDRVRIGATVRQVDVERDEVLHVALPLVRDALKWVGHAQTRNRGTIGGSLVHADPSAELPLAAVVLGATLHLASTSGSRTVDADDFAVGPMMTAIDPAECLTAIDWPVWSGPRVVTGFDEVAMRHGDFAMAAAACQLQFDGDETCVRAALGLGGVDGRPRAFPELAARLVGRRIDSTVAREIAADAVADTEPGSDLHASADYRRHLARVLLARILVRASATQRRAA
jgi:aerobic carbon-monoxide dehydrogenase medium subunit